MGPPPAVLHLLICIALENILRPRMQSGRAPLPPGGTKLMSEYSEEECRNYFRFTKTQLSGVILELGLPDRIRTKSGYVFEREAATLLWLRVYAMAQPHYRNLRIEFRRNSSALSECFHAVCLILDDLHGHLVDSSRAGGRLRRWRPLLMAFANAVEQACQMDGRHPMDMSHAPFGRVCLFIDGVFQRISRPGRTGLLCDMQR